jgi:uncharacterized protein YndB with AHSA1/START domain
MPISNDIRRSANRDAKEQIMTAVTESPMLEVSRCFAAKPDRVFDAWLSKEWGEWLAPAGAHCRVATLDARIGGRYEAHMKMADGRDVVISGTYREIVRPEKLVLTWMGDYNNHETLIAVTFRRDGAGTMMTLKQTNFPDEQQREGYTRGWDGAGGCFDKLEHYLLRGE